MLDVRYPHVPKRGVISSMQRAAFLTCLFPVVGQCMLTNSVAIAKKAISYDSDASFGTKWQQARRELQTNSNHVSSFFYDKFSTHNQYVRKHAASAHALKMLYEYDEVVAREGFQNFTEKIMSTFWLKYSSNTRAIRNRKQCIEQLLIDSFERLTKRDGELRIMSVASGSAEAVVSALEHFCGRYPKIEIRVLLIDIDRSALTLAKKTFANQLPKIDFKMKVGSVFQLDRVDSIIQEFNPNLIEKAGFLDYITNEDAPEILQQLQSYEPGVFITCNIMPNIEQLSLHHVVMWEPMVYRQPKVVREIMIKGHFEDPEIYVEPHKIHVIGRYLQKGL